MSQSLRAPTVSLSNVLQELQISRECALLGNYETSLLYFESVLTTLHLQSKASPDPDSKESWMRVRQTILKEFQLVKEIAQELASFKVRHRLNLT